MKRFLFALLLSLICLIGEAQVKKVAILNVVDKAGTVDDLSKFWLKAELTSAISKTPGFQAYDRTDLDQILSEQNFQRTGMVSDDQIKKLGEMTGAAYVLVAEAMAGNGYMAVSAKILDVETAGILTAENTMMKTDVEEIKKGCEALAAKLFGSSPSQRPTGASASTTYQQPQQPYQSGSQNYVEQNLGLNMRMVYVEGGTFQMGATSEQSGADDDERPVHNVTLDSYYIAATEVTQAQWQAVMGTTIHQQASKAGGSVKSVGSDYPMYYVSWEEAQAFCRELSNITGKTYLLPTEAQWEYAARGGKKSRSNQYAGSYSVDAVAWYSSNSGSSQHPVGKLRPNELGLYDMSGNLWEWCSDWYGSYSSGSQFNPVGPSSGFYRVLRGGSWYYGANSCRVAFRGRDSPSDRYFNGGFRVVCLP